MNALIQSEVKTMSTREIAELTGKQHSKVMKTVRDLMDKGIAKSATLSDKVNEQNKQIYFQYELDKRDSLVLVARLSPEFTAAVIDRWQELENKPQFQIPQTLPEALQLAADLAKKIEEDKPKIEVYEKLADRKADVSTTIIAKQLGTTAIMLNRFLRDNGVKWQQADLPKAGYSDWFNVVSDVKNNHEFQQCLVTPLGQIEIAKLWESK
jgi:phage regulator Rha-like protein